MCLLYHKRFLIVPYECVTFEFKGLLVKKFLEYTMRNLLTVYYNISKIYFLVWITDKTFLFSSLENIKICSSCNIVIKYMLTQIKIIHVVFVIYNLLFYPLKSEFIASLLKVLMSSYCSGM
jgi:hypothetical protein